MISPPVLMGGVLRLTCAGNPVWVRADRVVSVRALAQIGAGAECELDMGDRRIVVDGSAADVVAILWRQP